jgi:cytochrome c oxidase subunit 2
MHAQEVLAAAGPQAREIEALWWLVLAVCACVFVAVLGALGWALVRGARAPRPVSDVRQGVNLAVGAALVLSTVLLVGLAMASFFTDRALAKLGPPQLEITLTGHRWWWDARYPDFTTANELHIPVGTPVLIRLEADDVIHSFWVPNLSGKKDLIPGRHAALMLQADRAGVYRGQCAEFCGLQHAKMALFVVAEPPERYAAWAAEQAKPAAEPRDALARRGRALFTEGECASCHAIRGTSANARKAPDLTHLASRGTLAAGALPNGAGHLAGWMVDPQAIKPGALMPATRMSPDELQALLAYLGALK